MSVGCYLQCTYLKKEDEEEEEKLGHRFMGVTVKVARYGDFTPDSRNSR